MKLTEVPAVGIHHGIRPEVYHSWRAFSHSWMKKLRISAAHLLDLMEEGPEESTDSQDFGTGVHCMVLEPDQFDSRFAVRPEGVHGNCKEGRAFKKDAGSKIVFSYEQGRWCEAVSRRTKSNHRIQEWMNRPHDIEDSVVWQRDGYFCRARIDLVVPGLNILADLKTTLTASEKGFAYQMAKYRYYTQAAWCLDGMRRLTGQEWDFWFIAAEKRRPFLVTAHQLVRGSREHDLAVAECDSLFELYKRCCEKREWPGYGDSFEVHLPEWVFEQATIEEPLE